MAITAAQQQAARQAAAVAKLNAATAAARQKAQIEAQAQQARIQQQIAAVQQARAQQEAAARAAMLARQQPKPPVVQPKPAPMPQPAPAPAPGYNFGNWESFNTPEAQKLNPENGWSEQNLRDLQAQINYQTYLENAKAAELQKSGQDVNAWFRQNPNWLGTRTPGTWGSDKLAQQWNAMNQNQRAQYYKPGMQLNPDNTWTKSVPYFDPMPKAGPGPGDMPIPVTYDLYATRLPTPVAGPVAPTMPAPMPMVR